jgi:exodeoxyribonuclease VIII
VRKFSLTQRRRKNMQPGVYPDLSNAEYHGGPGVSKSILDLVARSPMHAKCRLDAANDNTPTTAQAFGTAFHTLILEPHLFVSNYTLGLRQSDVPEAIAERDVLVAKAEEINAHRETLLADAVNGADGLKALITKVNETRLPKISTSGSKAELATKLKAAVLEMGGSYTDEQAAELEGYSVAQLKANIDALNGSRPGHLPTSGSISDMTISLRVSGCVFATRQEIIEQWERENGRSMFIDAKASMADLAHALRSNGVRVTLWTEAKDEWHRNNGHRIVLTQEDWDALHGMREAIHNHPAAYALLYGMPGKAEQSVYWNDPTTGELCRCRPDFWRDDNVLVDLKTTEDASQEGFAKSIVNWRYHVQDAFYTDGIRLATRKLVKAFVFVAVEKKPPYAVGVYMLDQVGRDLGRLEYARNMVTWAECRRTNEWPGYSDKIEAISLPAWHVNKHADALAAA